MNFAKGDYSTVSGGQQNTAISNYGTILGGYANVVNGRFGTVLGGSKNTASGRHSAALGFSATAKGDYSMVACFTGDPCETTTDNTIDFFAENFYINDVNLNDVMPSIGRLLSEDDESDSMQKAEELVAKYTSEYEGMIEEVNAAIAAQDALLNTLASVAN